MNVAGLAQDYWTLCKPKVVFLMLVTVWVGMHLASKGFVPASTFILATLGIAFCAGSAAVINHLVDRHIDAKMLRTQLRPIASGRIQPHQALKFSILIGGLGLLILTCWVNTLTAFLTFATLLGYAVFYTLYLKRATPQNIVIGGLAGATPPLLGWVAVTGEISPFSLILVAIIFTWTPPHFWALAIYRADEYRQAKIPMLPVTHGIPFTKLSIVLYTLLLVILTLFPYLMRHSGLFYFIISSVLNIGFLVSVYRLYRTQEIRQALKTFQYSIVYLLALFAALLLDHYIQFIF